MLLSRPGCLIGRREYLFIVSHMRSFSSLLGHILGSSPDIVGYSECHQHYRSRLDLLDLRRKVDYATGGKISRRYVLDKILHDYEICPDVLHHPRLRLLFLVRPPRDTLSSIVTLEQKQGGRSPRATAEGATAYYVARLAQLQSLAEARAGQPDLSVNADALISDSEPALAALTAALELGAPLRPNYDLFRFSGEPLHGDPSGNIRQAHIVRERERPAVDIPDSCISEAADAYGKLWGALSGNTVCLGEPQSRD
jgi:hypothetical protein